MKILVDTNILVRLANIDHPHHLVAQQALEILRSQNHSLVVVQQVIFEWWAVSTRPKDVNGLGFTPTMANTTLLEFEKKFPVLPESSLLFARWKEMVLQHEVKGKNTHDARLAAAGILAGLEALLTFNGKDFQRFGLKVLDPAVVVQNLQSTNI